MDDFVNVASPYKSFEQPIVVVVVAAVFTSNQLLYISIGSETIYVSL